MSGSQSLISSDKDSPAKLLCHFHHRKKNRTKRSFTALKPHVFSIALLNHVYATLLPNRIHHVLRCGPRTPVYNGHCRSRRPTQRPSNEVRLYNPIKRLSQRYSGLLPTRNNFAPKHRRSNLRPTPRSKRPTIRLPLHRRTRKRETLWNLHRAAIKSHRG